MKRLLLSILSVFTILPLSAITYNDHPTLAGGSIAPATDFVPLWDTSASAAKKVTVDSLVSAGSTALIGTTIQAYDADLTTYAGITPSANVQSILGAANYAAIKTLLSLTIGTDVQAYDADLTTYAGITPSANVQSLLGAADYAAMKTQLGLTIGTNVQAYDADLTTYAGITPSANVQSILSAANYAAIKTLLALTIGTDVQAYDADLTTYAGITPSANIQTFLGSATYAAARTNLGVSASQITFTVDGGGSVITTGTQKAKIVVPFACTITKVTMLADTSTTTTCDIWSDSYNNYPPTIADTIVASAKPTLTAATKSQDSTLTGWTTSIAAGNILYFTVDTNNNATHLDIILDVTR